MNINLDLYNRRSLKFYLAYRLALALLLVFMFEAGLISQTLVPANILTFRVASIAYLLLCVASLVLLLEPIFKAPPKSILALLITDVAALMTMIYASGGVNSGLGYLLVVTAAIGSMFLRGHLTLAFAAAISTLVIVITAALPSQQELTKSLFNAGILGLIIFLTSLTFRYLSERVRLSAREAEAQGEYAAQIVQLAQHIVARMRTGIAVVDKDDTIELVNESALQLLGLPRGEDFLGKNLSDISNMHSVLQQWRENPVSGVSFLHELPTGDEIRIALASLNAQRRDLTILYIEDHRNMIQQAQQLKLASLGRLTASIAHEIRNPLGAISHAAQLLGESEWVSASDKRFTEIILQHSQRVNEIIESTMSLSKRKEPKTSVIDLKYWLPEFIHEYQTVNSSDIEFDYIAEQPDVKVDASHLRQILTNLFDNGIRYSQEKIGNKKLQVRTGVSEHDETTFVQVIDFGEGVPDAESESIFEPFFTTGKQGTGLGLYISRELCEINQVTLAYQRTSDGLSCFRLTFPHVQRMF